MHALDRQNKAHPVAPVAPAEAGFVLEQTAEGAGADACERVGDGLVAAHIIARVHQEVEGILPSAPSA